MDKIQQIAKKLSEKLVDEGKIIEGGFAGYRIAVMPENVSQTQLSETRKAFFAGAQHLFSTIISMLDPGSEPTDRDLQRMDLMHKELEGFMKNLQKEIEKSNAN